VYSFLNDTDASYVMITLHNEFYRGGDKSLSLPTSRCILFDGDNISFDVSLVIYTGPPKKCIHILTDGICIFSKLN
jgi:hypothetical protein